MPCKYGMGDDDISRKKKISRRDITDGLGRLAFGNIQDSVRLLYESEDKILEVLPELDLFNISEIKRQKGGGTEIRFFDRLKALEKLGEIIGTEEKQTALSFYDALEKSADRISRRETDDIHD